MAKYLTPAVTPPPTAEAAVEFWTNPTFSTESTLN